MRKVTLRGLVARRMRLALTLLAVALGVSLIVATYVFTDTINSSFDNIFEESYKGTDAAITPKELIEVEDGSTLVTIPQVAARDGAAQPRRRASRRAPSSTSGPCSARTASGSAPAARRTSSPRSPTTSGSRRRPSTEGRFPASADEAVIDVAAKKKEGFELGDTLTVQGAAPRKDYRIVGFTKLGDVDSFGGATVVGLVPAEAIRMLGKDGYDQIQVAAKPGITPERLVKSLQADLPDTVSVRTGESQSDADSDDIAEDLGFLQTFLLIFGFVSLFVGAFIIFNSFSITVAQRTREIGLLRALGANRRQVLRSVLTEGLMLGLVGSLVGLAFGIALAPLLRALFVAIGIDLPSSGLVIQTRTIVVPLVVGTLVALVVEHGPGGARDARRADGRAARRRGADDGARLAPADRGRDGAAASPASALIAGGLFGGGSENSTLTLLGIGVFVTFIAVALLSPRLVRPLASVARPARAALRRLPRAGLRVRTRCASRAAPRPRRRR